VCAAQLRRTHTPGAFHAVFTTHRDARDALLALAQTVDGGHGAAGCTARLLGRFREYAHFAPHACRDMRYEDIVHGGHGAQARRAWPVHAPCMARACSARAACVHCVCTVRAPCVHCACTLRAPCVHPACTLRAPCVNPACTLRAPCVHRACTLRAPCVHPACTLHLDLGVQARRLLRELGLPAKLDLMAAMRRIGKWHKEHLKPNPYPNPKPKPKPSPNHSPKP